MLKQTSTALIADDDEYFRLALASLLKGTLGFSAVEETGSLDEALERLSQAPDTTSLALFDLLMPGMDGPGTLTAVRELYPDILVAVVSSSQQRSDVLKSLEAGVHGYIPKRFGPAELVRALKFVLSGGIFVPAFLADVTSPDERQSNAQTASKSGPYAQLKAANDATNDIASACLSPRQREVLALLVRGFSNKQIANEMSLGEGTVKIHVAALLRNLGVANRAGAAAAGAILLRD